MKSVKRICYIFFLILSGYGTVQAQKTNEKEQHIRNLVNSNEFVFKAQSVTPSGGRFRQLTSDYDVIISQDTIRTYLPYFGRAYSAPIGQSEGGIQFTSTEFKYNIKEKKKGGWDITIKPEDAKDVRNMTMNVSEKGYATLMVTSNNRQFISFNGYITDRKQ